MNSSNNAPSAGHLTEKELAGLAWIAMMFPKKSSDMLRSVIKTCNGDIYDAVQILLEPEYTTTAAPSSAEELAMVHLEIAEGGGIATPQALALFTTMFPNVPKDTVCSALEASNGDMDLFVSLIMDTHSQFLKTHEHDVQRSTGFADALPEEINSRSTKYEASRMYSPQPSMISLHHFGTSLSAGSNFSANNTDRHKKSVTAYNDDHLNMPSTSTWQSQFKDYVLSSEMDRADEVNSEDKADWEEEADSADEGFVVPLTLNKESLECLLTLFGEIAFPVPEGTFPAVNLPLSLAMQVGCGGSRLAVDDKKMVSLDLDAEFCRQLRMYSGESECQYVSPVVVRLPVALARQIYSYLIESQQHQMDIHEAYYDRMMKDAELAVRLSKEDLAPQVHEDTVLATTVEENNQTMDNAADLADMRELISMFPTVNCELLRDILEAEGNNLEEVVVLLRSIKLSEETIPSPEELLEIEKKKIDEAKKRISRMRNMVGPATANDRAMSEANYYRQEVCLLSKLRDDCFRRINDIHCMDVLVYAQVTEYYKARIEEANAHAASAILEANAARHCSTTLDLHFLRVVEAKVALEMFLDGHVANLAAGDTVELFLIVGRGKHSVGGRPVIKPTIQLWLKQVRRLHYEVVNPGMLKVIVVGRKD